MGTQYYKDLLLNSNLRLVIHFSAEVFVFPIQCLLNDEVVLLRVLIIKKLLSPIRYAFLNVIQNKEGEHFSVIESGEKRSEVVKSSE